MFGLGWAEMMVAAVVALIVIGPKELPVMFRKIGLFVGKARGMAREFSRAMNDAADSAGVKDVFDDAAKGLDTLKEPTKVWTSYKPGSETAKLAEERAAQSKDLQKKMAENKAKKDKAASESEGDKKPAKKKAPAKKPAKKAAEAKPKTAAKKPAKKVAEAKPKAAAKKPPAKKKAPAKKAAAQNTDKA